MRTRKASAALLAAVLTLGLGSAACGGGDSGGTTGEGNLRDAGEQNQPSEGGDTGDSTEDDSAPVGGTNSGSDSGGANTGGTNTGP